MLFSVLQQNFLLKIPDLKRSENRRQKERKGEEGQILNLHKLFPDFEAYQGPSE